MDQIKHTGKRLSSLDYLRGLAAFGIMVFHYSMWSFGFFSAENFLGRVGIYGVAIFYVLSGLTLYHVYYPQMGSPSRSGLINFSVKRLFRIMPLLWLMSLATLALRSGKYSTETIVLNFTGLFSIWQWDDTICYGAWSIGNELVFYLFFPVFIFLSKRSNVLFALFSLLLLSIFLWFSFIHMDSTKPLGEHFADYTNPLNQVFLFLAGYIMAHVSKGVTLPRLLSFALIFIGVLAFVFIPASGDSMHLVTGFNRVYFTIICGAVCFCCYKTDFGLPEWMHRMLQVLGEISYSVYLVHPVSWYVLFIFFEKYCPALPSLVRISIAIPVCLGLSYLIYRYYEVFFMRLGKKAGTRLIGSAVER